MCVCVCARVGACVGTGVLVRVCGCKCVNACVITCVGEGVD